MHLGESEAIVCATGANTTFGMHNPLFRGKFIVQLQLQGAAE